MGNAQFFEERIKSRIAGFLTPQAKVPDLITPVRMREGISRIVFCIRNNGDLFLRREDGYVVSAEYETWFCEASGLTWLSSSATSSTVVKTDYKNGVRKRQKGLCRFSLLGKIREGCYNDKGKGHQAWKRSILKTYTKE